MNFHNKSSSELGFDSHDFWYIDKGGWIALIGGIACAFIPFFSRGLRWVMSYLAILIHEVGHSVVAWLFGYPSVPTFNLQHGGGLARHSPQANWLLIAISIVFILFVINNYKNRRVMILSGVALLVYLLCLFTPLHEMIKLYMGKGFEIFFAAIFIYRAASNWAVHHLLERFLYGFVGFYLVYENIVFSWLLLFNKTYRADYLEGIAPGLLNDFHRIWIDHLGTASFNDVVFFHLILTTLCPFVAIGLHYMISRNEERTSRLNSSR